MFKNINYKKIISLVLILSCMSFLFSCKKNNNYNTDKNINETTLRGLEAVGAPKLSNSSKNSKNEVLVVAFAEKSDDIVNYSSPFVDYYMADLTELKAKNHYTSSDLSDDPNSRVSIEQNNENEKPEILNKLSNINKYKYIFLGFPIWQGKAPRLIYTFLDSYNFNSKYIIPYTISDGDDFEECVTDLKKHTKGNPIWLDGKSFGSDLSVSDIANFLDNLNLEIKMDEEYVTYDTEEETVE